MRLNQRGYTLAGALCLLAVMSILMAMAVPLWSRVKQRDKEEELVFRGKEYVEAIARYHQKFGSYPPDLETLEKLKFIRKLYADPMTKSGKWKVLNPAALVQTGAAGTINKPGDDKNKSKDKDNKNRNGDRDDDEDDDSGSSFFGGSNDDASGDSEESPGLGDDEDDKNADEEEEVEVVGPIVGVVSRSKKESLKVFDGQNHYNKWVFAYVLPMQQQQQQQQQRGGPQTPGPQQQQQQQLQQSNQQFNQQFNQQQQQQQQQQKGNPVGSPPPDEDNDNDDWEKE